MSDSLLIMHSWPKSGLGVLRIPRVRPSPPPPRESPRPLGSLACLTMDLSCHSWPKSGPAVERMSDCLAVVHIWTNLFLGVERMSERGTCDAKVDKSKTWGEENKRWKLYISRFFDCQYCEGYGMTEEKLDTCHASWLEHYEFAYCRFHRSASPPPPSPV